MKFLCGNCKAKYQIADEKVAGRTLRMTCRHCKEQIVIRGTSSSGPPASSMPSLTPPEPAGSVYPVSDSLVPEALRASRVPAPPVPPAPIGAAAPRVSHAPPPLHFDAWHVAIDDRPLGPLRRDEVAARVRAGEVGAASLAWREGMDDWLPAGEIPELRSLFGSRVPPMPAPAALGAKPPALPPAGGARASAPEATAVPVPSPPREPSLLPDRVPGTQNWALMFALAGGFVLAMTSLLIFGVHLLRGEPKAVAPPAAAAPVAPPTPVLAEPELPELDDEAEGEGAPAEATEDELALDEVEVEEGAPGRARRTAPRAAKPKPEPAKELTQTEKEMLARMGGGDVSSDLGRLRASSSSASGGAKSGSGLTSAELTKVVQRGRESLQRCYEKALRTAGGSQETVRMDVQITVSPSGNVTRADVTGNGLPGMKECLERTVRLWRFPEAGDTTQTKFPLVFQPGG